MPLYDFECGTCGKVREVYAAIDKIYQNVPQCCANPMARVFSPSMVIPEIQAYQSPISGKPIYSRKQKREDLKRNQCVEYEPSLRSYKRELRLPRILDE